MFLRHDGVRLIVVFLGLLSFHVIYFAAKVAKNPKTILKYGKSDEKQYPNMEIWSKNNIQIWKCKNWPCFTKKSVFL